MEIYKKLNIMNTFLWITVSLGWLAIPIVIILILSKLSEFKIDVKSIKDMKFRIITFLDDIVSLW